MANNVNIIYGLMGAGTLSAGVGSRALRGAEENLPRRAEKLGYFKGNLRENHARIRKPPPLFKARQKQGGVF